MAITHTNTKNPASVVQIIQGRYLDDAANPAAASLTSGFIPRKVRWVNDTDRVEHEWVEGRAAGTTVKTAANGTRTLDTNDAAISVDSTTGVVTIAAAVILQNKQYSYELQQ